MGLIDWEHELHEYEMELNYKGEIYGFTDETREQEGTGRITIC